MKELTKEDALRQIKELQEHVEYLTKVKSPEDKVRESIVNAGLSDVFYNNQKVLIEKIRGGGNYFYIMLPLPTSNIDWTISAYEWMKTYVGYYREDVRIYAYPTHRTENDNTNYLYIKVEVLK